MFSEIKQRDLKKVNKLASPKPLGEIAIPITSIFMDLLLL